jgi:hypothetical protein
LKPFIVLTIFTLFFQEITIPKESLQGSLPVGHKLASTAVLVQLMGFSFGFCGRHFCVVFSQGATLLSFFDASKFFCGQKHKFGLNCQAVADCQGRFLDMSIRYPASTSDCLAFESSKLYNDLKDGLLAQGLCLFGNNAYLNSPFLATPYPNVSGGYKDAYNFFHSQLRIRVECAFGMFV